MDDISKNNLALMYNKSYEKFTPDYLEDNFEEVKKFALENVDTLKKFFENYCEQFNFPLKNKEDVRILDLGCGIGGLSLYLAKRGFDVSSLDISSLALTILESLFNEEGVAFKTYCSDVTKKDLRLNEKFDLIIDSHLLHCLTSPLDRERYFSFVKNHLDIEGKYLLETMAYHSKIQTPVGYSFDDNYSLWQNIDKNEVEVRKILPSIELENEILNSGLKIHYLYYHSELSFNVFTDYPTYPVQYLPKTIRIGASLS